MDRDTQSTSWTAVNQSSPHTPDGRSSTIESYSQDHRNEKDENVRDGVRRTRKRKKIAANDVTSPITTQSIQPRLEDEVSNPASQLSTPPPTVKRGRIATYGRTSRKVKPLEESIVSANSTYQWTTTEQAVKHVQYGLTKTTLEKLSKFRHSPNFPPQIGPPQDSATVFTPSQKPLAGRDVDSVSIHNTDSPQCIHQSNDFSKSLPKEQTSHASKFSADKFDSLAQDATSVQASSILLDINEPSSEDCYDETEIDGEDLLALDDPSTETIDRSPSTNEIPCRAADTSDEFHLLEFTDGDLESLLLSHDPVHGGAHLSAPNTPFSSKDFPQSITVQSSIQRTAAAGTSSSSLYTQTGTYCSANADTGDIIAGRTKFASSGQAIAVTAHSSPKSAQRTQEEGQGISSLTLPIEKRQNHFVRDPIDDYSQLLPFARPDFPSRIHDRSPIVGVSPSRILRTCFRIGEACREASLCHAGGQDTIFELYARVITSSREPTTSKQLFQFADLFHDRPPHPAGLLENYKSSQLQETEARRLLGDDGVGRLIRCLGRMKRESRDLGWSVQIINVRPTDWEEIGWTKRVLELK